MRHPVCDKCLRRSREWVHSNREDYILFTGEGGQTYGIGTGRGGGGVIVNGKMPRDNLQMGKGYGRGASWDDDFPHIQKGFPGCVIFDK